jgi:biopolymer transport protein ExbB/TolQ
MSLFFLMYRAGASAAGRLVPHHPAGSNTTVPPTLVPGAVLMDIPTWLIEILRQFPMVVVIGLAVWWTYNRLERREVRQEQLMTDRERRHEDINERLRQDMRMATNAEIQRSEKHLADAIADKNKEIERLMQILVGELKKLTREVDQLSRKLKE